MTTSTSSRRRKLFLGFGLLLLAALLRFLWLDWASLQVDEVMSLLRAGQWRTRPDDDVHPPLFFACLELWAGLSFSEAWLRALPALCSWLGCVLWWSVLGRWGISGYRRWAALSMVICSFADIQQAREVRMYSLLQLFCLAHLWSLQGGRWWLQGLTLLGAAFTHLFGLFLIPLGWFSAAPRRRLWGIQAAVAALWLLWGVPHYWAQQSHPLDLRQRPTLAMAVEAVGRLLSGRVAAFGDRPSLVLGGVALVWLLWRRPGCARLVYAWALLPLATVWTVSALTPVQIFEFKYLIWTMPAWALLLAQSRAWLTLWVLVNLGGLGMWLHRPGDYFADWRGVARMVREQGGGRPALVHPSMMAAPLLYYRIPGLEPVDELSQIPPGRDMLWITTPHHPFVARQALLAEVRRFWEMNGRREFPCRLPSGQVEVTSWHWKGPSGASEKQPGPGLQLHPSSRRRHDE